MCIQDEEDHHNDGDAGADDVLRCPRFAYEIEVEEGDVTITDTLTIEDSIVQSCGASVVFGYENENVQLISNSQNVVISIDGDGNEVEVEQSLEQSGFSPEVSTDCTQSVAQAFSF